MTFNCVNGDCLEVMKSLPDNSIDLFVCDLPYGCLIGGNDTGCPWDVKLDLTKLWTEIKRLCKNENTPILMFGNMRFGMELVASNPSWFRYELVWNKNYGTHFLSANKRPMSSHEFIFVFAKKSAYYKRIDFAMDGKKAFVYKGDGERGGGCYGLGRKRRVIEQPDGMRCPLSVLNFTMTRDKRHPTAKPIELLKWLVERYSKEGDMVIDPTAGSFNSGRACIELGRNYIGIEMNTDFFEKNKL